MNLTASPLGESLQHNGASVYTLSQSEFYDVSLRSVAHSKHSAIHGVSSYHV